MTAEIKRERLREETSDSQPTQTERRSRIKWMEYYKGQLMR